MMHFRRDRPADEVEERWGQPPSRYIVIDGLRTHYRDQGRGGHSTPLVLLHGSYSSLHTWEGWAAVLAHRYRVVSLDLPGHGLTGPDPDERYGPTAMADFVAAFAARFDLQRFVVVGNSMGGRVAAEVALRYPHTVRALILIDSAGLARNELDRPAQLGSRIFESAFVDSVTRWLTPRFLLCRALASMYGDPTKITEVLVDRYEDMILRDGNRHSLRGAVRQTGQAEFEARLAQIRAPTLILWGALDQTLSPRHAERFRAKIGGSRAIVFERLGHLAMEEDPAGTGAEALRFLDALDVP